MFQLFQPLTYYRLDDINSVITRVSNHIDCSQCSIRCCNDILKDLFNLIYPPFTYRCRLQYDYTLFSTYYTVPPSFFVYIVIDLLVREHTISPDGSVDPGALGDRSRLNLFPYMGTRNVLTDPFIRLSPTPCFDNFKISSTPQYYAS